MEFRLELISLLISPFFFFSFFDKYTHLFFITCFEGESSPPPPPIKQRQHYFSRCHKNNIFRHCNRNYGSMSKKKKKIAHIHIYKHITFFFISNKISLIIKKRDTQAHRKYTRESKSRTKITKVKKIQKRKRMVSPHREPFK